MLPDVLTQLFNHVLQCATTPAQIALLLP